VSQKSIIIRNNCTKFRYAFGWLHSTEYETK